jgi:hypothetical protein
MLDAESVVFFVCFVFETGFSFVATAGIQLAILLSQRPY